MKKYSRVCRKIHEKVKIKYNISATVYIICKPLHLLLVWTCVLDNYNVGRPTHKLNLKISFTLNVIGLFNAFTFEGI